MKADRKDGIKVAMAGCDEIEAALRRVRELLKNAESYRKNVFYRSFQPLYEDVTLALERTWLGFIDVLKDLPE